MLFVAQKQTVLLQKANEFLFRMGCLETKSIQFLPRELPLPPVKLFLFVLN